MSAKKVYRFKAYNGVALLPSQISESLQIVPSYYIDQLNAGCKGTYIVIILLKDFRLKINLLN